MRPIYSMTVYPSPIDPDSWCAHIINLDGGEYTAPSLAKVLDEVRKRIQHEERKR